MDHEAKKKILIVGATGFIGSNLVDEALTQDYEVYAGIRKTSNLQFLSPKKIQLVEFDLSSKIRIYSTLRKFTEEDLHFDHIVFNAGITYAKRSKDFFSVNVGNTINFTEGLKESGMQFNKFLFISSLAAFGPGNSSFEPIETTDQQKPISSYGKSKLMAEEHITSLNDFPYLIVNPTAVYGPRDKDFLKFISLIRSGFEFHLGKKGQMVSLIHVKDLAKAVISLLSTSFVNRSYIISDKQEYNKEKIAEVIRSILDKKTIRMRIPAPVLRSVANLAEKIYGISGSKPFLNNEKLAEMINPNWLCNSSEVWEHINDKPSYSLETGMKQTIEWYKENHWL